MIFLGLDAGSTGIKCVAFSENGVQLSLAYSEYPTSAGAGDMNADTIFDAAKDVIARCVSGGKVERSDVAAISVTSFGEACVPVAVSYTHLRLPDAIIITGSAELHLYS